MLDPIFLIAAVNPRLLEQQGHMFRSLRLEQQIKHNSLDKFQMPRPLLERHRAIPNPGWTVPQDKE